MTPKLGASLRTADARFQQTQATATRATRAMGTSIDGVRKRIDELRITANKTTDWRVFKDATRQANELEKQIDRLQTKASGGSGIMGGGVGLGLAAGAALAGGIAFTKNALELAAEREKQQTNLSVMTGSKVIGDNLFSQIQKMADVTPFETRDLLGSAQMLMQYGLGVNKLLPTLQKLGDISGADKEKMNSLTMAFGKVISEGKLNGRALEEMIYAGFNPLNYIAKQTGLSMQQLRKDMEKGAIGAGMVEKAMDAATGPGGRFFNLMQKQSETLSGKYSTLMDNIHHKMADFGTSLIPIAKAAMDLVTRMLDINKKSELMDFNEETQHLRALRNELSLTNISNERRRDIFDELKTRYPELLANINNEKDALARLNPLLDGYLQKRYLASGALEIRSKYAKELANVDEAREGLASTHGQLTGTVADLAGEYNIDIKGMTTGQAQIAVQNALRKRIASGNVTKGSTEFAGSAGGVSIQTQQTTKEEDALERIGFFLRRNNEYQKQYKENAEGARKAAEAQARFNKLMGINDTSKPLKDDSTQTGLLKDLSEKAMSGQKEITITIQKMGIDKFELNSVNVKEGVAELEKIMKEMFLRVVYSAQGLSTN